MRFITDLPVGEFIALLKTAACLVGNSSAGIKECSFLGTPVVNVGARQQGRLHAENVTHADDRSDDILEAVRRQIAHGRYPPSDIYHRPGASQAIVDVLANTALYTQKRFFDAAAATVRT
jgi:UDP-N-acetylglucosamine 2-epimerase